MPGMATLKFAMAVLAASLMNLDYFYIVSPVGLLVSFADS